MEDTDTTKATPYILAIGSFAVHGTASLKTFIKVLGSYILPVPSLMLNGLTNMAEVKKFEMPLAGLLESTMRLAVYRKQRIVFYTGYLGSAQQVETVLGIIEKYRSHIIAVITDPVCGDHGSSYVSPEIISGWPEIIKQSDIVFPNFTELKLITGHPADAIEPLTYYINYFKNLYPGVTLAISSYLNNEQEIGVQLHTGLSVFEYYLPLLPQNFGGSGDLLLALFIRHHYLHHIAAADALMLATIQTYQTIKYNINNNSTDLLLNDYFFNDHHISG